MSVTVQTVTHTFTNADGTPASGEITFRLTKRMTNGPTTYVPATITANLNSSGQLSQTLLANNDTGTFPQDAQWACTFRILGSDIEEFMITVPATGTSPIDLGTLLPTSTEVA